MEITQGIDCANVIECDIFNLHNTFVIQNYTHIPAECYAVYCNRISDTNRNRVFSVNGFRGGYSHFSKSGQRTLNFKTNDSLEYIGESLKYFFVLNPSSPGACGLSIMDVGQHNFMICSGLLSGCSFAVLFNGHKVWIIHAGANVGCDTSSSSYIYADLYCMAKYLATGVIDYFREQLTFDTCITVLEQLNFHGYIFYSSPLYTQSFGQQKKIIATSYLNESDVICVINKKRQLEITLRNIHHSPDDGSMFIKNCVIYNEIIKYYD